MLKFTFLNFSFQFNLENTKDSTYFLKQGYVKLKNSDSKHLYCNLKKIFFE